MLDMEKNHQSSMTMSSRLGVSNVIERCKAANGNQADPIVFGEIWELNLCGMMMGNNGP